MPNQKLTAPAWLSARAAELDSIIATGRNELDGLIVRPPWDQHGVPLGEHDGKPVYGFDKRHWTGEADVNSDNICETLAMLTSDLISDIRAARPTKGFPIPLEYAVIQTADDPLTYTLRVYTQGSHISVPRS